MYFKCLIPIFEDFSVFFVLFFMIYIIRFNHCFLQTISRSKVCYHHLHSLIYVVSMNVNHVLDIYQTHVLDIYQTYWFLFILIFMWIPKSWITIGLRSFNKQQRLVECYSCFLFFKFVILFCQNLCSTFLLFCLKLDWISYLFLEFNGLILDVWQLNFGSW